MELNRCEKTLLNLKKLHDSGVNIIQANMYINGYHTEQQVENEENEDVLNAKIVGLDLSYTDFGNLALEYLEFYDCNFTSCEFLNGSISGCTFIDCNFNQTAFCNTDITGVAFVKCNFEDTAFTECNMQNIKSTIDIKKNLDDTFIRNFTKIKGINDLIDENDEEKPNNLIAKSFKALQQLSTLGQNYFENIDITDNAENKNKNIVKDIDLNDCHFEFITFVNLSFEDINFIDSNFTSSRFINCDFKDCSFEGANLKDVFINSCNFNDCILSLNKTENLKITLTKSNTTITNSQNTEIKIN